MTFPPIRAGIATAAVAGVLAMAGCGSGDDTDTAAAEATRSPAPTATAAAAAAAAEPKAAPVPATLRGSWRRVVRSTGLPQGAWRLEIGRKGSTDVYTPRTQTVDFTMQLAVDGRQLTLGPVPICASTGTYTWRASGRHFTLAGGKDTCSARTELFEGTWTRER